MTGCSLCALTLFKKETLSTATNLFQILLQVPPHLTNALIGIDTADEALASVVVQHGAGGLVELLQARYDDLAGIIRALEQIFAGDIILAGHLNTANRPCYKPPCTCEYNCLTLGGLNTLW